VTAGHSFIRRQPQISLFSLFFFDGRGCFVFCVLSCCVQTERTRKTCPEEREGERNPCRFRSSPYCGMGGMTSNGCLAYRVAKPQQLFGYFSCRERPITFFFVLFVSFCGLFSSSGVRVVTKSIRSVYGRYVYNS
jgi:hypothetical protein